jgi:alkylresorcinol/alkylpyrone synthase
MSDLLPMFQRSERRGSDRQLACIIGLGTNTPLYSISQTDAAEIAQSLKLSERWQDALPSLYRRSGVDKRGSVLLTSPDGPVAERQSFYKNNLQGRSKRPSTKTRMQAYADHAGPLLYGACVQAIEQAQINPSDVTHLITVSCTGFYSPGIDFEMIRRCELSPSVQRFHIGFMGCHAALNGLNMARAIVQADPRAVVLVAAVELCSLHQQYSDDPQQLVANALFADGAAAMIITQRRESFRHRRLDDYGLTDWNIRSHRSYTVPDTQSYMRWTIGDEGFAMTLDPQVPIVIERSLAGVMQTWLAEEGITIDSIDGWAVHPGGPRIVESAGSSLGLKRDHLACSLSVLAEHGNMSSPTVLFILEQLLQSRRDMEHIVMLAFGPGLCIEATLLCRELDS